MSDKHSSLRVVAEVAPLRQRLIETLRKAILEMEFLPGQRLVERDLCERTGVSRTSLREAFRHLEAEGLITIIPNKGPIVTKIDVSEAMDIYYLRQLLEVDIVRLFVAKASDKEVQALSKIVEKIESTSKTANPRNMLDLKAEFYSILLQGAGNATMSQIITSLQSRIGSLRATSLGAHGRIVQSARELREMVDAIQQRDSDKAMELCRIHLRNAASAGFGSSEDA